MVTRVYTVVRSVSVVLAMFSVGKFVRLKTSV